MIVYIVPNRDNLILNISVLHEKFALVNSK